MGDNTLVVAEVGSTEWYTAMGPVESFAGMADALGRGDWVEGGLNGVAGSLETLGAIADPAGALLSAGVGWVLEHLSPFPEWLDELAGNPDAIHAMASTWHNVSQRLHNVADEFLTAAASAANQWDGVAIDAYRLSAKVLSEIIDGFGTMVTGVAAGVEVAGALVAGVRALVRDGLSQLVGYGLSKLAQLLSLVLAPKAISEICAKVAEWTAKIGAFLKNLITSMGKLGKVLDDIFGALGAAGSKIKTIADKWDALPVNSSDYDFDAIQKAIKEGTAVGGGHFPSLASVAYTGLSESAKHTGGLDDRPN